jgi:hypothetical protein
MVGERDDLTGRAVDADLRFHREGMALDAALKLREAIVREPHRAPGKEHRRERDVERKRRMVPPAETAGEPDAAHIPGPRGDARGARRIPVFGASGGPAQCRGNSSRAEHYRKLAVRYHELGKYAQPSYLGDFYRGVAVRYVFMAQEASERAKREIKPNAGQADLPPSTSDNSGGIFDFPAVGPDDDLRFAIRDTFPHQAACWFRRARSLSEY